jgi:F-type H+-transporting ATPase subunit b
MSRQVRLAITGGALLTVGMSAVASEGGGGAQALLTPHIGTVFWTLVTFIIMLWVLGRYAWKPILGALESREKTIRDSIDSAKNDRAEAKSLLDEQRTLLAEAHRQRAAALDEGRKNAEVLKAEILDQANKQREQLLKQTEEQVKSELRQARAEMGALAADLAIQAAEKLLTKNLDGDSQRKLVEDYLAGLESGGASH